MEDVNRHCAVSRIDQNSHPRASRAVRTRAIAALERARAIHVGVPCPLFALSALALSFALGWLASCAARRRRASRDAVDAGMKSGIYNGDSLGGRGTVDGAHVTAWTRVSGDASHSNGRTRAHARESAPARLMIVDLARGVETYANRACPTPPPPSPPSPVSTWSQRPIHMTTPSYARCEITKGEMTYNDDVPFQFETPVFKGKCLCRFRDCDPPPSATGRTMRWLDAYFRGKKRTFQYVVQGRFKQSVRVDRVFTGHEFRKPLVGIPGKFLIKAMLRVVRVMNPSLTANIFANHPQLWSSLAGSAQTISVDDPGGEPDIASADFVENTHRFGGAFARRRHVSCKKRRRLLSNPKHASRHEFRPEHVYTFDFYQHFFKPDRYVVDVPGILGRSRVIDVAEHTDGEPAQIMARDRSTGHYLFCFALWHERLFSRPRPR